MYASSDYDGFTKVLEKLALVFSKKLSDEVIAAYWEALKDQTLVTVSTLADRHIRTGKFWPKPVELRPKDAVSPSTDDDGKFQEGEERAMRNLEEMREKTPDYWMAYVEKYQPGCLALGYAREFGPSGIWYDIPNRCWRRRVMQ
jgi:hypothetical protein